MRSSFVASEF